MQNAHHDILYFDKENDDNHRRTGLYTVDRVEIGCRHIDMAQLNPVGWIQRLWCQIFASTD
jgi:hypothetical protein